MLFTTITAALIATISTAAAAGPTIPQAHQKRAALQPSQITDLGTSSHPALQYLNETALGHFHATITDSNPVYVGDDQPDQRSLGPSTAECNVQWPREDPVPFGQTFACATTDPANDYASWSVELAPPAEGEEGSMTDFLLQIYLSQEGTVDGAEYAFDFQSEEKAHFTLSGRCSAGGLCGFSPRSGVLPYSVAQVRT